jgi:imidazoleglycerol-phosphate dehydratase
MATKRSAAIKRKTKEVDIQGSLTLDGAGNSRVKTGFEPLDHLLTLFAFHGFFDLDLKAAGDLPHHIIEDLGIALGKAFKQALGEKEGISRYGCFTVVMDKVAVEAAVDISGRPSLTGKIMGDVPVTLTGSFDSTNFTFQQAEEFLESFLQHAGISLVYVIKSGDGDLHHVLEALFKAIGKALDQATLVDPRRKGIPSTKGVID